MKIKGMPEANEFSKGITGLERKNIKVNGHHDYWDCMFPKSTIKWANLVVHLSPSYSKCALILYQSNIVGSLWCHKISNSSLPPFASVHCLNTNINSSKKKNPILQSVITTICSSFITIFSFFRNIFNNFVSFENNKLCMQTTV